MAEAVEVSLALNDRAPPLVTNTPNGMFAFALAVESVSAIAAATLMGPPLVDALGDAVPPEPVAPAAPAALFAWLRSPRICPSTPPAGAPALPWDGAPAADAVALEVAVEMFVAVRLTAPPALTLLRVVASAA